MSEEITYAEKLGKLVSFKTVTNINKDQFDAFYEEIRRMFPLVFSKGEFHELKCGFYLVFKGKEQGKPILFMNHHDVVEATGDWKEDPFSGLIKDGVLHGRGTLDTKGGFFCMFTAMEELLEDGFVPKYDTYLFSTADEEIGGPTAAAITQEFYEKGVKFRFILDEGGMILHDPVGFADGDFAMVGVGEKTCTEIKISCKGNGGHTSMPPRNTPVIQLAKFILDIENSKAFKRKVSSTVAASFKCFASKSKGILKFVFKHAKFFAPILKLVAKNMPSLNAMLRTTASFTMIKGSEQTNVIPANAYVTANIRIAPHDSSEYVFKILNKYAKKYGLTIEVLIPPIDTSVSSFKTTEFDMLREAVNSEWKDVIVTPYVSNTGSDSRHFRKICDTVYCFVPFFISKEQLGSIHGNNESVDIVNLPKAIRVYKQLMQM